jgi:tetratricopeptide (TPR) repeat protein
MSHSKKMSGTMSAGETIGQRLRRLRLERGLPQRELAAPGVSYAYISRIEAGQRQPSVKAIRTLARKLGISAQYLETGSATTSEEDRELRLADAELRLRLGENLADAEDALRLVLEEAGEAGDTEMAARAEIALGLAAAQAGRHNEAVDHLERATAMPPTTPATQPDVYITLGNAYLQLDRPEQAAELYERCLDELADDPEDSSARIRFVTHLSYALSNMGRFAEAKEILSDLTASAGPILDPYGRIRVYWSLARLASMEGHPRSALRHLRRAIALLESTEDTLHLARAHLLCSEILILDGEVELTEFHLDQAERLFELGGDAADLASVRAQQAKRAALLGDTDEAVEFAESSLALSGENPLGSALFALGLGHAAKGNLDEATAALDRAVALLSQRGEWREAVQAARAWAEALRKAGRFSEAFEVLDQAADLAERASTPALPREER